MYEQKKKRITTFLIVYKLTSVSFFFFFSLSFRAKDQTKFETYDSEQYFRSHGANRDATPVNRFPENIGEKQ